MLVDPHLPEWLPEISLERLRVGRSAITLRFYRNGHGATHFEILEQQGRLRVLRQPTPWSLTASAGERVRDLLESLVSAI